MTSNPAIQRVVDILCDYRNERLGTGDVDAIPDLEIIGLYAARVAGTADYLVHAADGLVEEVAFDDWPPERPTSRRSRSKDKQRTDAMRIEQIMSREVRTCRPDETLDTAAYLMWTCDCGCLPVCTGDGEQRVVGMLTDRDICMSALFEGKPLRELRVADAMSRTLCACRPGDDANEVARLMGEQQVRRIPVVDRDGRVTGIVSLADLARDAWNDRVVAADGVGETLAAICEPYPYSSRGTALAELR
jgi:CBS domain-containing protein